MTQPAAKPPAKPAAPAAKPAAAKPATPPAAKPVTIIEFVDHVPTWGVILTLAVGLALGAAAVWLVYNLVIEDATDG